MALLELPKLYAILDGTAVRSRGFALLDAARALRDAGIRLLQYRDKDVTEREIRENAYAIQSIFAGSNATLILNDWPEIVAEVRWHGVHVGQSDASVADARRLVGDGRLVGVSTHSPEQFCSALESDADYIAFGPIFGSMTKQDAESPVGIEGLQEVRKLSRRPLVAIGGISVERMSSVFAAGADTVAVIGALFQREQMILNTASHLLRTAELFR